MSVQKCMRASRELHVARRNTKWRLSFINEQIRECDEDMVMLKVKVEDVVLKKSNLESRNNELCREFGRLRSQQIVCTLKRQSFGETKYFQNSATDLEFASAAAFQTGNHPNTEPVTEKEVAAGSECTSTAKDGDEDSEHKEENALAPSPPENADTDDISTPFRTRSR